MPSKLLRPPKRLKPGLPPKRGRSPKSRRSPRFSKRSSRSKRGARSERSPRSEKRSNGRPKERPSRLSPRSSKRLLKGRSKERSPRGASPKRSLKRSLKLRRWGLSLKRSKAMVVTSLSLSMSVRAHQKCLRLVPRSVFRLESALASVRSCGARNVFQCPEKTPRPEGVPNVYRQQKIFTSSSRAISVPGPSIRQIFSAACAPSQSSWTSQRFTTSSGPPTKALRLLFSHHDFKHCAASISSTFVGAFSFSRRRRLQPGRRLSTKKFSSVQILPLLAGNIPNLSLDLRARQMLHDICLKTRATFPFAAAKLQVRKAFFPYSCQQQKERFPYAAGHLSWRRSLPGR